MEENTNRFRNAIGGFHKADVTAYIERMAAQHRSELLNKDQMIADLQEENRSLQQQLNLLMMSTPAAPAPVVAQPEAAPMVAPEPVQEDEDLMRRELQAYRRAEAAERNANKRVRKLYAQMEGACDGALEEFQTTDAAVRNTIEVMQQQAAALEDAYQTLAEALRASRETLAAMNEELEEFE